MTSNGGHEEASVPLLEGDASRIELNQSLISRVWVESKKLWSIVGPTIFSRMVTYSMLVITQAFVGHLGDLPLGAIAIANNLIVGFDLGILLGMASALETLCGQAFGAKKPFMLGVYLQRSWIVLTIFCIFLLPVFIFTAPILKILGIPEEMADLTGKVTRWMIPLHFAFAFQFPLQRFFQCQLKTYAIAVVAVVALAEHVLLSWLLVYKFKVGVVGAGAVIGISWWVLALGLMAFIACGKCSDTWTGFSAQAFSGLWEFVKLSAASGLMLCLENWYYRILVLMTGNLENAEIAIDALSICMTINSWELMIPLSFFAGAGVRVANELGSGNGKGAKFAMVVAVGTSLVIGMIICILIMVLKSHFAVIFSTSKPVLYEVDNLYILLAFTILLNSVQPVLSGVAVGSGWQAYVAYINLACYYLIGVPLGLVMGWPLGLGVKGIWAGMIFGGTAIQTMLLCVMTFRCDWDKEAQKAYMRVKRWSTPDERKKVNDEIKASETKCNSDGIN